MSGSQHFYPKTERYRFVVREEMSTCLKIKGRHTLLEHSLLQGSNKTRTAPRLVSFRAYILILDEHPCLF